MNMDERTEFLMARMLEHIRRLGYDWECRENGGVVEFAAARTGIGRSLVVRCCDGEREGCRQRAVRRLLRLVAGHERAGQERAGQERAGQECQSCRA
jgi:hypothetical protein